MIEVIVETGAEGGGWQFANAAFCEESALALTARTLWDESYTGVQGCTRRIKLQREDGTDLLILGARP